MFISLRVISLFQPGFCLCNFCCLLFKQQSPVEQYQAHFNHFALAQECKTISKTKLSFSEGAWPPESQRSLILWPAGERKEKATCSSLEHHTSSESQLPREKQILIPLGCPTKTAGETTFSLPTVLNIVKPHPFKY